MTRLGFLNPFHQKLCEYRDKVAEIYSYEFLITLQVDPRKVRRSSEDEENSQGMSDMFSDKTNPKGGDHGGGDSGIDMGQSRHINTD